MRIYKLITAFEIKLESSRKIDIFIYKIDNKERKIFPLYES